MKKLKVLLSTLFVITFFATNVASAFNCEHMVGIASSKMQECHSDMKMKKSDSNSQKSDDCNCQTCCNNVFVEFNPIKQSEIIKQEKIELYSTSKLAIYNKLLEPPIA